MEGVRPKPLPRDSSATWFLALLGFSLTIRLAWVGRGGRRGRAAWHSLVRRGCWPDALASPAQPAHLGFVFHGHSQLHPLPQTESTSVVIPSLIFKQFVSCSRSEGSCPVPADHPFPLQNEMPCPQTTWPGPSRSWGRSPLEASPGWVPALALPGMPTEERTPWGIHMPVP